jgi:hypothetical protein
MILHNQASRIAIRHHRQRRTQGGAVVSLDAPAEGAREPLGCLLAETDGLAAWHGQDRCAAEDAGTRDTMELHAELVPFDAHLAQEMSDRAVAVVRASEAGEWLPRVAAEPTAVLCRGGMAAGKWHAPCPWASRCWNAR